ncbi:NeuD/PglB/VioB family sugar acetyltransferase [Amylibacter sp.]|nr:NeuD/PglB/VioB family sugar acetyltransferase [Amylibacter sp.]
MKKRKCIILGAGGQCRVILSLLQEGNAGYLPIGIIDNALHKNEEVLSIPVLGGINLLEDFYQEGVRNIFLAAGDNFKRKAMFDTVKSAGFDCPNLISDKANVSKSTELGEANIICPFVNVGPQVKIINNNLINTHSTIEHETVIQSHSHVAPMTVVGGRSLLGDFVFLGAGTTIIDKISIVSNTSVAAGSVVINDIERPGYLYAGVPAISKKRI